MFLFQPGTMIEWGNNWWVFRLAMSVSWVSCSVKPINQCRLSSIGEQQNHHTGMGRRWLSSYSARLWIKRLWVWTWAGSNFDKRIMVLCSTPTVLKTIPLWLKIEFEKRADQIHHFLRVIFWSLIYTLTASCFVDLWKPHGKQFTNKIKRFYFCWGSLHYFKLWGLRTIFWSLNHKMPILEPFLKYVCSTLDLGCLSHL